MQVVTEHPHGFCYAKTINRTVQCTVCGKIIGLRDASLDGATGLAWFDAYNGTQEYQGKEISGSYVHYECLSQKRKDEIVEQERLNRARMEKEYLHEAL